MSDVNDLFENLIENQMDYSIPVFTGTHDKPVDKKKKPLTLRFVDDESGLKKSEDEFINDAMSSTERVRKYYKRHPKKVRAYLKKTQDDRVARNRDRRKAVEKYGEDKMKNHDVHHPNGAQNGSWRLAKKDHGPDKKDKKKSEPKKKTSSTPTKKTTPQKKTTPKPVAKKPKSTTPATKQQRMVKNIKKFVMYVANRLRLKNVPDIDIIGPQKDIQSLGWFNPETKKIHVVVQGRLLADILRTIAHELVHLKQSEMGIIKDPRRDGATGSEIENQANAVAGIIMRDYGSKNPAIYVSENKMLSEGGAYGHLAHPYEDLDLTFADFDEMLNRALVGNMQKEGPVLEKMDGQNISFTVKDGEVKFARNKGHLKNRGEKALSAEELGKMFGGRGEVYDAFSLAAADIESAVKGLSEDDLKLIFDDGQSFMAAEIIYPGTRNVIPYDKTLMVFHGTLTYDDDGNNVKGPKAGEDTEMGKLFADVLTRQNASKQKTFGMSGPRTVAISDQTSAELQGVYEDLSASLERLQKEYGLKEKSTLGEYYEEWLSGELDKIQKEQSFKLSNKEKDGLIRRWAYGEKKFGVKDLSDDKKEWFKDFESNNLKDLVKVMRRPVETVFLRAGVHSLKRVVEFLSANNPMVAEKLKSAFATAVKTVRETGEEDKIATLETQLARLKDLGIDKLIPSEGLIFTYNGNPYKLSGSFAPVNQIMRIMKYDRGSKKAKEPTEPEKSEPTSAKEPDVTVSEPEAEPLEPQKPVGIFPGRFQPFHADHYVTYLQLVKKFGKDRVYIATSDKQDAAGKSPFSFNQKVEIMTKMFGIPEDKIVKVKSPYRPEEITKDFPENTPVVFAISEKDKDRLGGKYFTPYDPDGSLEGHATRGYVWVKPAIEGKQELSGTQIRYIFGNPQHTDRAKEKLFTTLYGKFDRDVFDMLTKVSTKAEEDRQITTQHKEKKEPSADQDKVKELPPDIRKKAQSILSQKIKNPKTGNMVSVAYALYKREPTEPVHKLARKKLDDFLKSGAQTSEIILTEEVKSVKMKTYLNVRDFEPEELANEAGEYFDNEKTFKAFPDLAKDKQQLIDMINNAPTVTLERDDLKNLANSDVSDILRGESAMKIMKQFAEEDKKALVRILKAIKTDEKLPFPIVIKHPTGYYLLGGNRRLSVLASMGKTMPVKLLTYEKKAALPSTPFQTPRVPVDKKGVADTEKEKEMFKRVMQMKITNPVTGNQVKIDTAMDYNKQHPAHLLALNTIRHYMKGISTRAGVPKKTSYTN